MLMSFAPAYLVYRLLFRIAEFFRHWYADGGRWFVERLALFSQITDRTFGVRLPGSRFRASFPLPSHYRGFFARTLAGVCGTALLAAGTLCAILAFAVWASLPALPLIFAAYDVELDTIILATRTLR